MRDAKASRTACIGTSLLFPVSTAAERVHALLEELVQRVVREGRWDAQLL